MTTIPEFLDMFAEKVKEAGDTVKWFTNEGFTGYSTGPMHLRRRLRVTKELANIDNWPNGYGCPITFTAGKLDSVYYPDYALRLGLSMDDARQIAVAADGDQTCNPEIRKRLFEIAGIPL